MANTREPIATGEVHWPEIDITARWQAHSHWMDFQLREGTQQPDGSICYMFFPDGQGMNQPTDEFAQADRFVDGSVKWDGCSHLYFGDENGYLHLCGGSSFRSLSLALARVFQIAAENIPRFDPQCADLSALAAAPSPPSSLP